jgi:hypothetical protein|tara:strand:- start:186 stop:350 length:165 start_codon:yes stop_codon:yes gene_type:complete
MKDTLCLSFLFLFFILATELSMRAIQLLPTGKGAAMAEGPAPSNATANGRIDQN